MDGSPDGLTIGAQIRFMDHRINCRAYGFTPTDTTSNL